ncbi:NAD(+)/NADH kinase, partial [Candidatus Peregrinibacteria bacterium]|nr:NAD(+)/NADH kinase [Candidatus Peregrinibacteria bacterium]
MPKVGPKQLATVGIITKRDIESHKKALAKLFKYLKGKKKEVLCDNNAGPILGQFGNKKEDILKKADLVVTLGGDGTILKTARRLSKKKVIVLGINYGTLGFLTECEPDKMIECLDRIFKGNYHKDKRSLLRVTVYRDSKKIDTYL